MRASIFLWALGGRGALFSGWPLVLVILGIVLLVLAFLAVILLTLHRSQPDCPEETQAVSKADPEPMLAEPVDITEDAAIPVPAVAPAAEVIAVQPAAAVEAILPMDEAELLSPRQPEHPTPSAGHAADPFDPD